MRNNRSLLSTIHSQLLRARCVLNTVVLAIMHDGTEVFGAPRRCHITLFSLLRGELLVLIFLHTRPPLLVPPSRALGGGLADSLRLGVGVLSHVVQRLVVVI